MRRRTLAMAGLLLASAAVLSGVLMWPSCFTDEFAEGEWTRTTRQGRFPCDEYDGRCLPQVVVGGLFKGGTSQLAYDLGTCHPDVVSPRNIYFEPPGLKTGDLEHFMRLMPVVRPSEDRLLVVKVPKLAHYLPEELEVASKAVPSLKVVLMLRNPADRDYSHFRMVLERWKTRSMDGVVLPRNCPSDTNLCFLSLLKRYVLLADSKWRNCAAGLPLLQHASVGGALDYEEEVEGIAVGAWVECVRRHPREDWRRKLVIIDQAYTERVRNVEAAFGSERLLLVKSEDFFAGDASCLEEIQHFAGLDVVDVATCTANLGSAKKEDEKTKVSKINVTPLGPGTRALLTALHRLDVEALEAYTGRSFGWE